MAFVINPVRLPFLTTPQIRHTQPHRPYPRLPSRLPSRLPKASLHYPNFESTQSLHDLPDFHPLHTTPQFSDEETTTWSGDLPPTGPPSSIDRPDRGDDDPKDPSEDPELTALLSSTNTPLSTLPPEILTAYRNGFITVTNISNFLHARANVLSNLLLRLGPGMRNRFMADKLFLLKIMIEEGIGVFGKLSAEYEQRREDFFKQGEFVFANLITAILADFALVYLPAPSVVLTRGGGKGFGAWLSGVMNRLPSNIFQTDRPFTLAQRAAGFALKGGQLFAVGMACCFIGVVVTNSLVFVRERVDKSYNPSTQKPNPLMVSLLYATFLGLSSGSRYQLVNGVESHIFPRLFAKTPRIAEEVATFLLRYGNTFWGSQQWVMFCRFTNVQKVKAE